MGDTIWILSSKTYQEDDDRSVLLDNIEYLDEICGRLSQKSLSAYLDYADYEANLGDEWPGDEVVHQKKKWHNAAEGLEVFKKLYEYVKKEPEQEELASELNDCVKRMKDIVEAGEDFHLGVIM